jgi:hypothetical protein
VIRVKITCGLMIVAVLAAPAHCAADECDAKAAEIVANVGGSVSSRFDAPNSVVHIAFSHPVFYGASLYCRRNQPIGFIALTKETYPAPPFYDAFAKSVAFIIPKTNADAVRAATVSCVTTALREKGQARGPVSNWVLQCTSNSKDGTSLQLFPAANS